MASWSVIGNRGGDGYATAGGEAATNTATTNIAWLHPRHSTAIW
jgi:hypothetical protein